jgi:predicted AAA+ superfamily ATPase
MLKREASSLILTMAQSHPLLIIAGPRCAGKSFLTRYLLPNHSYINLELPENIAFARKYPIEFLNRHKGNIIIDEFRHAPELFKYIRDVAAQRSVVLITSRRPSQNGPRHDAGSAVAGMVTLLQPSIQELEAHNIRHERDQYIHMGFIPDAYRINANPWAAQFKYLTALLRRDIAPLIRVENRKAFKRFFRLLAERIGLALNLRTFAETVGVQPHILVRWIRVLEAHFVVFRVPVYPSRFRVNSMAISAPKFYFTDVGLAAYLLKIQTPEQVYRHPAVGNLFENLVVAEALKANYNMGQSANMFYYRDREGFEIDLILPRGRDILPIEVKSGSTFDPQFAKNIKRFHTFAENILDGYVVYCGTESDRVPRVKYINFREVGEIVRGGGEF